MMIKNFGARVEKVWEGLRPVTKKMIVGALQASGAPTATAQTQKFSYDTQSDWELSRLLTVLDEQEKDAKIRQDAEKLAEIRRLAETCVLVLEAQTGSAEVFIQLAERILKKNDYNKFDKLSDTLSHRFSTGEIAEIVRQTETPQIRAVAYETLALAPVSSLLGLLDDPLYAEIAINALEQQAFEYDSEEARQILDQLELEGDMNGE
ncbi:MAG: hypothetical protein M3Q99_14045 [Acidobacteriota bacterium]|nr:hypothetical protein [Acidobacteriota bacterium]